MDLHTVTSTISKIPMGGTDCSLPMKWAERKKAKIDVFIVYTDNETYFGDIHPSEVNVLISFIKAPHTSEVSIGTSLITQNYSFSRIY